MNAFLNKIIFIFLAMGFTSYAFADCTSPAGVAGELKYIYSAPDGSVKQCDGSSWRATELTDTAVACTVAGTIRFDSGKLEFCGRATSTYTWRDMTGTSSGAGGACSPDGKFEYHSAISSMRVCSASVWKRLGGAPAHLVHDIATPFCTPANGGVLAVTVTNDGDLTSSAISVSLTGADAANFSISTNDCTILTSSATCLVEVQIPLHMAGPSNFVTLEITATDGGLAILPIESVPMNQSCSY